MELNEFLVEAKKRTYAAGDAAPKNILENGGHELVFNLEEFRYRDVYYGFDPFSGEEIVSQNGIPIWSMNYYGKVLDKSFGYKEIYGFLQRAMSQLQNGRPFRGPSEYKEGDWKYTDESQGDLNGIFSGIEKIFFKGKEVYELVYHGGSVKNK